MYTFYIGITDAPAPVIDAIRKCMAALRLLLSDQHNVVMGEVNPEGTVIGEGSNDEAS